MASHSRIELFHRLLASGLLPTLPAERAEETLAGANGLLAGGAVAVELLARGDHAYETFRTVLPQLRRDHPDAIVGVGSIVDAPTAALYLASGADFVVGPDCNEAVARVCNRRKVAWIPGCGTVTEIGRAEELGAEVVKLFPAAAFDGPEFVRSLRGPQPWSRVMATGNAVPFDEAVITRWIEAGACALSMGPSLAEPRLLAARDADGIAARTVSVLAWIAAARQRGTRRAVTSPKAAAAARRPPARRSR